MLELLLLRTRKGRLGKFMEIHTPYRSWEDYFDNSQYNSQLKDQTFTVRTVVNKAVYILQCNFVGLEASGSDCGAAIYTEASTLIEKSTFSECCFNSVTNDGSGAIFATSAKLVFALSCGYKCVSEGYSGGDVIAVRDSGTAQVNSSAFISNGNSDGLGSFSVSSFKGALNECNFSENIGGFCPTLYCYNSAKISAIYCEIICNKIESSGGNKGIVYTYDGNIDFSYSNFKDNELNTNAYLFYCSSNEITLTNCNIYKHDRINNNAVQFVNCYIEKESEVEDPIEIILNSLGNKYCAVGSSSDTEELQTPYQTLLNTFHHTLHMTLFNTQYKTAIKTPENTLMSTHFQSLYNTICQTLIETPLKTPIETPERTSGLKTADHFRFLNLTRKKEFLMNNCL